MNLNGEAERDSLQALLERIIRVGVVSARFPDDGAVQVDFRDVGEGGVASFKCPVLQPKTKADKIYWMPDKGERVLVLSLPQGKEQGIVVGSYYNERDEVPESDNDKAIVKFEDGTAVIYDRSASELTVDAVGAVKVTAADGIALDGGSGIQNHKLLVHPKALSDFTGKPIQPPSDTMEASP